MSTAGPNASGTMADDSAVGTLTWSNPSYIASSNNTYATVDGKAFQQSHYLIATDFGFGIPAGATINGITVSIERKASNNTTRYITDTIVSLVIGGTVTGNNKADTITYWPTVEAALDYGGIGDIWGLTPSVADVNATNFGAVLSVTHFGGIQSTASVDFVSITITYTAGGGGGATSITAQQMHYARMRH